jgi:hypothetical protein
MSQDAIKDKTKSKEKNQEPDEDLIIEEFEQFEETYNSLLPELTGEKPKQLFKITLNLNEDDESNSPANHDY